MKKEIPLLVALLLAGSVPGAVFAEDRKPATPPVAPAKPAGDFFQFLSRWSDVCPADGQASKNSWQSRYNEDCSLVLRSADRNAQPDKDDLARYDRGYKYASGLYKLFAQGAWTKAGDLEKELGRKTENMMPDYGTKVDPKLRAINLIYVYLGPDAVKELIGPDGKSGKLGVVRKLEHPNDPGNKVTPDEMSRYFSPDAKVQMASAARSKEDQQNAEKASQGLARMMEKGLEPISGDPLAGMPPPANGAFALRPGAVALTPAVGSALPPVDPAAVAVNALKTPENQLPTKSMDFGYHVVPAPCPPGKLDCGFTLQKNPPVKCATLDFACMWNNPAAPPKPAACPAWSLYCRITSPSLGIAAGHLPAAGSQSNPIVDPAAKNPPMPHPHTPPVAPKLSKTQYWITDNTGKKIGDPYGDEWKDSVAGSVQLAHWYTNTWSVEVLNLDAKAKHTMMPAEKDTYSLGAGTLIKIAGQSAKPVCLIAHPGAVIERMDPRGPTFNDHEINDVDAANWGNFRNFGPADCAYTQK